MSMSVIRTARPARKRVIVHDSLDAYRFPLILLEDPSTKFVFWGHISMADEKNLSQQEIRDLFKAKDEVEIRPIMSIAWFWNNWGNPNNPEPSKMVKSPTGDYYRFNKYRKQIASLYGNPTGGPQGGMGGGYDWAPLTISEGLVRRYNRKRRILWLMDHAGGGGSGSTVNECCYWS